MRTCLVLGGAECVFDDLEAALDLGEYQGICGANHIGIAYPGVFDFWCTVHEEMMPAWINARKRRGHPPHKAVIRGHEVPNKFPGQTETASSGIFALKVALVDMGFDRAVLCGVPLSPMGHFYYETDWSEAHHYHQGLREALPAIRNRARSMSGHTRDVLGAPTADWVNG
jgi:hypothetical protein